ncbi:MAG TPA: S46 family peptidase [Prolixibacteraceae bacterium]|nr:S46 family peptidase [Prolixibacteraceae bacterium]HPR85335.1 S46 family peptidase [Prolixibacteraceae bacterium]
MKRLLAIVAFIQVFVPGIVIADEGMWLPALIEKLNINQMKEEGCKISAEDIYSINHSSLKDAVVALDHGSCTAELVSDEGLLLTNHHCGFDEIQEHSTVDHDYLQNGFWAKTKEEELPNEGKTASFLINFEDVTNKIVPQLNDQMSVEERNRKVREISNEIEKAAIGDTHYEARVQGMYNDNRYYLFVYETFRDIRLVGAPPQSMGKFGGDTDNWMWPRHTCDFSMFRIYCGKDGKPASYSKDNVPFKPKHHLPISLKGYKMNDFAMVLGYPGTTNRYKTSFGIEYTMNVTNPIRIKVRAEKQRIMQEFMNTSRKARIMYSAKYARSSNYYKYSIGQNEGLQHLNVLEKKRELENKFTKWVEADQARKAKYGEALPAIANSYKNLDDEKAFEYMVESMVRGPEIFYFAYRTRPLYDALKSDKNSERVNLASERVKSGLDEFFKDYDSETDQKIAAALFKIYADNVSAQYHPPFFSVVKSKYNNDFEKYTKEMYAKSVFGSRERLEKFFNSPRAKVLENDPIFQSSLEIFRMMGLIGEETNKTTDDLEKGNRLYLGGLMEMEADKNFYPDANSTMRLTYGKVGDYIPRDAVKYNYYTTLKGYIEKEIPGDDEFDVPAKLKELYYKKDFGRYADSDGTLHTCFLTNNDITGGNSGSPVINGNGELIGLAFDGNWEAMSGDIAFENDLQKCINVDIRFVLWTIDKMGDARNLINEMTIVQ